MAILFQIQNETHSLCIGISYWNQRQSLNTILALLSSRNDAVNYVEKTWLKWKEKLVQFWVNSSLHFSIQVISPIEGYHEILKSYLKVSTGDLKGIYDHLVQFWPTQHQNIWDFEANKQNKTEHHLKKPYFQSLVHDRVLRIASQSRQSHQSIQSTRLRIANQSIQPIYLDQAI